jgi:hypothetical protein
MRAADHASGNDLSIGRRFPPHAPYPSPAKKPFQTNQYTVRPQAGRKFHA